jgi:predicted Zn-dependent protease
MKHRLIAGMVCTAVALWSSAVAASSPDAYSGNGEEHRLWLRAEEEERIINQSGLLYEDPQLEAYLNGVARKLQPPDILEKLPFRILVLKDPHLNAFAFPNGVIYVHTGILARMENEAQLAILLAHEMTHCTHRHALKAFRRLKNFKPTNAFEACTEDAPGGSRDLLTLLGSTGALAAITGYTRELETQADTVGFQLVVRAGYDLKEGARLFDHLKEEIELYEIKEPFVFGSHPKLEKRVENCKRFFDLNHVKEGSGIKNGQIFLEKVHRVILENAHLDLQAGRFQMARRGLEKYLALKPEDARAYYLLGEVCRQQGDPDRAKALLEKAIALDPGNTDANKAIGLIYYKVGERERARRFFETCLALSPNLPDRAYIERYLAECKKE